MVMTYDDQECEVPRHEAQLDTGASRYTLETRKKAQDDGKEHHEHSKQGRRQDARNDAHDRRGQLAEPRKPGVRRAEAVYIGDDADKGH